jgi:crotonobetainyl-CoA:carnitine CoA-transferase CaiB-like acyl-CoA transferase
MMQYAITGKAARPMPERLSAWGIYDVFDCSDGQIFLGVVTDTQWKVFCEAFDFMDLYADTRLATNPQRCQMRSEFMPRVRDRLKTYTRDTLLAKAEAAGLPFAPIAEPQELFDDPHLNESGGLLKVTLPDGRKVATPALPLEIGGKRFGVRHDLPGIGEQGPEILAEIGYGPDEIEALVKAKVVGPAKGPGKA